MIWSNWPDNQSPKRRPSPAAKTANTSASVNSCETTLRRLGEVSGKLEELLAKQNFTLNSIKQLGHDPPSEKKIMKLRQFKQLLNTTLKRMQTEDYGLSMQSGDPIPLAQLKEMPWAEVAQGESEDWVAKA